MFDRSSKVDDVRRGGQLPADLTSELLLGMRLHGVQYRRMHVTPPFGIHFSAEEGRAQFHFVACGNVFLRAAGGAVHTLRAGDAALLPRGTIHDLVSEPDLPGRDVGAFETRPLCQSVCEISDGTQAGASGEACATKDALIFSGCMEFDLGGMHPLVAQMPEVMLVGTLLTRQPEIVPMLQAMEREVMTERAGSAGIVARLADVVSASIVRCWVECGSSDAPLSSGGWLEALRDPRLGRAIGAMHRDPGRNWTVAELASEMGASRSVFAERFLAVTGQTPLRYVTELRMRLATQWIGRDHMPIDEAARRLGYGSQAAFSRAFKRVTGRSPGTVRGGVK